MTDEDYLYHYGVKGMKWGVRKDKVKTSVAKRRSQNKQIRAIKKKRRQADRLRSTLPEKELDSRIKRLEKEERLHNLTKNNVNRGRTETNKILKRVGTTLATTALIGAGGYVLSKSGGKLAEKVPQLAELIDSMVRKK